MQPQHLAARLSCLGGIAAFASQTDGANALRYLFVNQSTILCHGHDQLTDNKSWGQAGRTRPVFVNGSNRSRKCKKASRQSSRWPSWSSCPPAIGRHRSRNSSSLTSHPRRSLSSRYISANTSDSTPRQSFSTASAQHTIFRSLETATTLMSPQSEGAA